MLIASRSSFLVKPKITTKNYVQNGLMVMWDGIENIGFDNHNSSANIWTDLSSNGHNLTLTGRTSFTDNALHFSNGNNYGAVLNHNILNVGAIEIIFRPTTGTATHTVLMAQGNQTNSYGLCPAWYYGWTKLSVVNTAFNYAISMTLNQTYHLAANVTYNASGFGNGVTLAKLNGQTLVAGTSGDSSVNRNNYFALGGRYNTSYDRNFVGDIFAIRFYSRALTAEEIAHNYAVDKIRFNLP